MALIAPMAKWRPLTRSMSTTPLTHNVICYHTMVGTLEGSWSWSNRPGGSYWHFGLGGDGELWQCQDLRFRSAANLEGNWRCIPIETEDTNAGQFPTPYSNPPWTPAQVRKLAELTAWLCVRFNIPCQLVPNSRPEHRGIAYHKQGCEPGVVTGGENWSSSFGKTCPNARINQVDDVIRMAQTILGGTPPVPIFEELPDMFTYNSPGKPTFFAFAGKSVGLNEATDLAAIRKAHVDAKVGLPHYPLDDDTYTKFRAAFPGS